MEEYVSQFLSKIKTSKALRLGSKPRSTLFGNLVTVIGDLADRNLCSNLVVIVGMIYYLKEH